MKPIIIVSCALWLSGTVPALAVTRIDLGTAGAFAVLAGATVTSSGLTLIDGDVGVSTGSAVTGFGPRMVNGTIHAADTVAALAQADLATAYGAATAETGANTLSSNQLGGITLHGGVYRLTAAALLDGTLTLDGQGDPNALFVFQIGSALTTGIGSAITFTNGGKAGNLFFQVGSSATLGRNSAFAGTILALTSITLNTGASIASGRALAMNGAVTLVDNNVSVPTSVPEPASWAMMLGGFGMIGGAMRRRRVGVRFG